MRVITGDEAGLVKSIIFPPKVVEVPRKKKARNNDDDDDDKKKEEPKIAIKKFGTINKAEAVQKLCWGELDGARHIVAAYKSGKVQYLDVETGDVVREYRDEHVGPDKGTFVGLHADSKHLVTCTSTGHVSYTLLSSYTKNKINPTTCISSSLGADLCVMRVHPICTNLFAAAGKENDLKVYDANLLASDNDEDKQKAVVFQAKNVRNDFLDLRVPVWIHDLQFLNEDGSRIVTATHYHQIRVYDTKKQRRPVSDYEIGKNPLLTLQVGVDYDHVIYTDTMSTVATVDLRKGTVGAHYKGFTGSVTGLTVAPHPSFAESSSDKKPLLASVSLDRFLRVHEMSTQFRRIEQKLYLKQRMTCMLVDETFEFPKEEEEEDQEENAMWEAMETVADAKPKRKRA